MVEADEDKSEKENHVKDIVEEYHRKKQASRTDIQESSKQPTVS